MVNISSFGRIEIVILLVVSLTAGGVIVSAVPTATEGSTDTDDTRSQTTVIDPSSTVTDEIAPEEVDWYAVDLNSGTGVTAQLRSDSAGTGPSVTLYGPNGVPVRSAESGNDTASNGQTASSTVVEQSGRHYVKVTAGAAPGPVSYELSVSTTKLDRYDPNEHRSQAASITPGSPVTGVMTGYDQEYFALDASAGDTLSIETTANGGSIGTVTVFGPGGEQIHAASDGTVNGVQLPRAGQYTIRLDANLKHTETLNYNFTATTNTEQTTTTDSRLTPGSPVHGTTTSTETTHTIDLTEGQGLSVALTHKNRTDHSNSLSFSIADPNGDTVGAMPADSRGAYRTTPGTTTAVGGTVAQQTGTYTISVSGEPNANYSLSAKTDQLDEHDPNEQPGTATSIGGNTTTTGVLTGYDRDVYAVDLKAGQTLTASSTSKGGFKSALWVAGPNTTDQSGSRDLSFGGSTITGAPGGATLTFTANQTGTHFLKVVPHPTASSAPTFFKSVSYEIMTAVSSDVSRLNVSTEESTTIMPTTITETTDSTTVAPNDTLTAPITPPNRPPSSTVSMDQSTTERPAINVGTGALFAFGSVFAAFIGVGAIEWWRQSGGL